MPKLILIIFCIFSAYNSLAQPAREYSFIHYSTGSGLLSNQVNTIVQDAEGYMWIGTTDGLQRFDGNRYKTFRHNAKDPASIPSNPVWQLLQDNNKNLWVLMADGRVGIFNTKKFTFREVPVHFKKRVSPNTTLKHLITDAQGHLFYLISGSEVITLNEKATEFSYTNNFFKQKDDWDIEDFMQQPGTQKYWISIKGAGLAVFDKKTGQLSFSGNNTAKEKLIELCEGSGTYSNLYFDRQNRLWGITWGTVPFIHCFDLKANKQLLKEVTLGGHLNSYHEIRGFFEQRDSSIWVKGLMVFAKFLEDKKQFQFVYNGYASEQSIAYETVHCLYEDRERNIWVATDNNGLYRFNPAMEFFRNVKHINHSNLKTGSGHPMSFITTRWGTILAGTWGDGLYEYDKDFNEIPVSINGLGKKVNPFAWCMIACADSNSIWMSAQPGIYRINQAERSFKFYNPAILKGKTIRQIAEDRNRNLWLGMNSTGVFKWTAAKGSRKFDDGLSAVTGIPAVQVNKITVDSRGCIWIGTPENGVYVVDPVTDKIKLRFSDTSENERKLPERGVSSVLEYNDSVIVITTATRIVLYNRILKRSVIVGTPEMISGFITAVEKDQNGYLWLTSTSGLYRINIQRKIFVKFNRGDGLDNEHFIQSASVKLPDGRIVFGTTNNFIVFDPAAVSINTSFPDISITGFKVMNKSLPLDSLQQLKEIELSYEENSLVIEFSSLRFNSVSLTKYMLEGLDKEWKISDNNNEAVYSYLPPGKYKFLVKTIDEEGNESTIGTRLNITVNSPFWKTWWFYTLLALAVSVLLFWLDRERMRRKETMEKMRSDIADNLHQDVNTVLNNINILSEMAKLKADKDIEKSKEYIQQIHSKSNSMIVALDDMLWSISPENDSMQKTIERFREHIDSLRNRYDVSISLLTDEKVENLKLNMKLRQHIFWLLKGGSTNIINTGAIDCKIHIGFEKPNLIYTLEFNNRHSDMQQLNNLLQRQELAARLEEVNGIIKVKVNKTISVIVLTVPVH